MENIQNFQVRLYFGAHVEILQIDVVVLAMSFCDSVQMFKSSLSLGRLFLIDNFWAYCQD